MIRHLVAGGPAAKKANRSLWDRFRDDEFGQLHHPVTFANDYCLAAERSVDEATHSRLCLRKRENFHGLESRPTIGPVNRTILDAQTPASGKTRRGLLLSVVGPLATTHSKLSCESSAGVTVIFFFGLACGAGRETVASSLSSFARIVFARSITLSGRPANRATWMP